MLNKIIKYALANRLIIIAASVFLLIAGIYTTSKMEVDVFPDLTAPTVVVLTEAHGMAPEEVERLVTFQIETAVNGGTDVRRVRSSSAAGISIVWVEFEWGTDIYKARQIVSEKLIPIQERFPAGVGNPTMAPQSSIMGEVMFVGLSSNKTSPIFGQVLSSTSSSGVKGFFAEVTMTLPPNSRRELFAVSTEFVKSH